MAAVGVYESKNIKKSNKVVKLFEKKRKWTKDKEVVIRLKDEIAKIPDRSMVDTSQIRRFIDLPISQKTLIGLNDAGYEKPTEIQKESLGLALRGLDILGAAKTGSGKTLAFLIPVIELLYRNEWTHLDRLGALIITPVRELAYQIFEVLKKIGKKHDVSAGLIIGGKDLQFERNRLSNCNIIICTPGRLLHHMDENPLLDCNNLKILVLDEADKIMELGFATTMNAIIENLPKDRQTLLFSATQTKSVKDLARLSLVDPVYVSVHENAKNSTPDGLIQSYIVCDLHDKFNLLWSFIKGHLKKKILVFMASCKGVKFTFEAICKLRPGMSVLALHGGMHQLKRMDVYNQFCNKRHAVLIATDIAARGLDFPAVNWVIQMDCPEDATTYIHRAGRTARFEKDGEALLVLLPSEEQMATYVIEKRIPITKIQVNPKKQLNVQKKLEALLAQNVELKQSAQRAFVAYMKSVYLMKDKTVFDVTKINTEAYARSLGLATAPRIRFLQRHQKLKKENSASAIGNKTEEIQLLKSNSEDSDEESDVPKPIDSPQRKSAKEAFNFGYHSDSDDEDQLFTVKRRIPVSKIESEEQKLDDISNKKKKLLEKPVTKAVVAKKILKKNIKAGQKIVFDDEGEVMEDMPKRQVSQLAKSHELMGESGIDIESAKQIMREEDKIDKEIYRQRVKAARQAKKLAAKKKLRNHEEEEEEEGEEQIEENAKQDEWSSGDESSVNLDFLPDPDKVYNKNKTAIERDKDSDQEESEQSSEAESEDNSEEETSEKSGEDEENSSDYELEESSNKRKSLATPYKQNKKREIVKETTSGLSLQDSEALALRLLDSNSF